MPPSRLLGALVVACLCSGSSSFSWNVASSNNRWAPSSHPASTGCRHLHPLRTAPTTVVVQSSPFGLGDDDEEDPADFLSEQERLKLERESDLTPEPIAVQSSPFGLADNDEEDPADFLSDLERLKLERASEFVVSPWVRSTILIIGSPRQNIAPRPPPHLSPSSSSIILGRRLIRWRDRRRRGCTH